MVLTEKDLISSKPIIKRPRSFNPAGAIGLGISLGASHALLYASLWQRTINGWYAVFAFLLLPFAIVGLYLQVSLTAKYSAFSLKIEGNKTKSAIITREALLSYLGFVPSYGFLLVYSVEGIKIETLLITMITYVISFVIALYSKFNNLIKNKVSLGYLLQWKFDIYKVRTLVAATAIITILTAIFLVACLI